MKLYRCDKCGREVKESRVVNVLMQPATWLITRSDSEFDLCEECADLFERWLCGEDEVKGEE